MNERIKSKKLKTFYIERVDISYCTVQAYSKEDAVVRSGDGSLKQNWDTIVGKEVVTELKNERTN